MDRFTETYIEMASKAKEIQGLWQDRIKNGEYRTDYVYYYDPNNKEYKVDLFLGIHEYGNKISHNLTISPTNSAYGYPGISWQKDINEFKWLPTLEDLFGMIDIKNGKDFDKLSNVMWDENAFGEIVINPKYGNCNDLHSMILILVMEMNYNKSWNPNKKEWEERNGS